MANESDTKNPTPIESALVDGSALAGRALAAAGVSHMFGVVGIPVTAVATRAVAAGVRFIAFHNEQSAGYAASAYGYLTGRAGVLLTVSGPGCVHGLAGLSNAWVNTWPMVMISGSCDQADFGKGDFQVSITLFYLFIFVFCLRNMVNLLTSFI
jgi:2-hydroxyacyl-CoA lyase 1